MNEERRRKEGGNGKERKERGRKWKRKEGKREEMEKKGRKEGGNGQINDFINPRTNLDDWALGHQNSLF